MRTRRDFPIPSHGGENVLLPPYAIENAAVQLSNKTAFVGVFYSVAFAEHG